eukprot:2283073-Rhodomonas_salina.1
MIVILCASSAVFVAVSSNVLVCVSSNVTVDVSSHVIITAFSHGICEQGQCEPSWRGRVSHKRGEHTARNLTDLKPAPLKEDARQMRFARK